MALHPVRPYQFFALFGASGAQRVVQAPIPPRRAAGTLSLLEIFIVLTALKVVDARRIFEFGTFLGATTLALALNIGEDGQVFTLDLGEASATAATQVEADAALTAAHLAANAHLDFAGSAVAERIVRLVGDSIDFDPAPYRDSIDAVLVDGGHDLRTLQADTRNAFAMVRSGQSSCVVWHDYGNPAYPDLTAYLDELAAEHDLVHIQDTMLCVWFSQPDAVRRLQAA